MPFVRLVFALVLLAGSSVMADDHDLLRSKWWTQTTGGTNYSLSDTLVRSRLQSLTNTALTHWNSMNKAPGRTYLWSDLTSTTVSAQIVTAYSRLRAMALAYATYGSYLRSNSVLAVDIQGGLDWMYANRYNETKAQYDNWFHWEIGAPLQIVDIAVLMYDALGMTGLSSSLNTVEHFTPSPTNHGRAGTFTGANLADRIRIVSVRGAVVKDGGKLASARAALGQLFPYVTSGDGYYIDGSFVQHSRHAYTGGYGYVLLADLAVLLPWLQGSPWECTDPARTNVIRWIYDSYEPLVYRGAMMDMTRGRGVSRSGSQDHVIGHSILQSILQLANYGTATDRARIRSMVRYWALADSYRNFTNNVPLPLISAAVQLMNDPSVSLRGELQGHWTYASMDRVVHLRPGWGLGLSMCSSRIYNYEYMNGENLKGWFQGDGVTYLYNDDLAQFGDDFWATVDPYKLPGTTVDTTPRADGFGQSRLNSRDWVGGVTLLSYGAAGMDLEPYANPLRGKKSWFMFDDEIVCLGAGIASSSEAVVQTTVENRKISSSNTNSFILDGIAMPGTLGWSNYATNAAWCWLGGAGAYYFPGGATLNMTRQARSGSWSQVNTGGSTTTRTRNYLTVWFDHGVQPANAGYAYVRLPGYNASQVGTYAGSPQIAVLENSPGVQAVKELSLNVVAANFWSDSPRTVDLITCQGPAAVMTKQGPADLRIAAADPTQLRETIAPTLSRSALSVAECDPAITILQLSPAIQLSVNVSGSAGRSFAARFVLQNTAPSISSFGNRMTHEDTATGPMPFTVWDDVTAATNLVVTAGSTNTALLPPASFTFSGSGSNRALSILPATNQTGTALVNISVTDGQETSTSSFQLTVTPVNDAPIPGIVDDVSVHPGAVLSFPVPVSDPEAPPQTLSFQLLSAPTGAVLGAADGVFNWRPAIAQAGSSNYVQWRVSDDGVPSLSATEGFAVLVQPAQRPSLSCVFQAGAVVLQITGPPGPDYLVESSTNLVDWIIAWSTNTPALPLRYEDAETATLPQRFYRVKLGP